MRPFDRLNQFLKRLPLNLIVVFLCVVWVVPTFGVLITSFRSREAVRTTGWWTALNPFQTSEVEGQAQYDLYCASCHGAEGDLLPDADLSNPALTGEYARSNRLLVMLRRDIAGAPHLMDPTLPEDPNAALEILAPISNYIDTLSGGSKTDVGALSMRNYADAIVGYKGTSDYISDCELGVGTALTKFQCSMNDILNPEGMGRAFINTLMVTIPSTLIPILFAGFAAYAFAWMDFPGRMWIFALLVGLQVVPLQMALIPIARLYADVGLQSTFVGVWLFHTGFGLPYAIYLLRNFMGGLPREIFESIYIDGANHWTAFWKLALPLSLPAVASLGIFQFIWVWNDFLVAKIFLSNNPVLTVQITNLIDPRGGNWHILTGAAFLSFLVPMIVFFSLQRFFVRGMLGGSVKG